MITLKIQLAMDQFMELRTKIKLESDSPENTLPFENLVIEAAPFKTENSDIQIKITNAIANQIENNLKPVPVLSSAKQAWWRRLKFISHR